MFCVALVTGGRESYNMLQKPALLLCPTSWTINNHHNFKSANNDLIQQLHGLNNEMDNNLQHPKDNSENDNTVQNKLRYSLYFFVV